jgi:hypothetical protein
VNAENLFQTTFFSIYLEGGQFMTTQQSFMPPEENIPAEQLHMTKQIGSAAFKVVVLFSGTSQETMEDKLLRLIEREGYDDQQDTLTWSAILTKTRTTGAAA